MIHKLERLILMAQKFRLEQILDRINCTAD